MTELACTMFQAIMGDISELFRKIALVAEEGLDKTSVYDMLDMVNGDTNRPRHDLHLVVFQDTVRHVCGLSTDKWCYKVTGVNSPSYDFDEQASCWRCVERIHLNDRRFMHGSGEGSICRFKCSTDSKPGPQGARLW